MTARRGLWERVPEVPLSGWGFVLNLAWEAGQTPLYVDSDRTLAGLVWNRLHCTLGDVLILLGTFWVTALAARNRRWITERGRLAVAIFIAIGILYTAWSEWWNVSIRSSWAYREAMPTVFGIGLAPLSQWLVVPSLVVTLARRRGAADHMPVPPPPLPSGSADGGE